MRLEEDNQVPSRVDHYLLCFGTLELDKCLCHLPVIDRQICGDFHPMTLCLHISIHRRCIIPLDLCSVVIYTWKAVERNGVTDRQTDKDNDQYLWYCQILPFHCSWKRNCEEWNLLIPENEILYYFVYKRMFCHDVRRMSCTFFFGSPLLEDCWLWIIKWLHFPIQYTDPPI